MLNKIISSRNILIILFSLSSFALISAYIAEYFFGLAPCQLCLWQRVPFFAIIIFSGLFLIIPFLKKYQNLAVKITILLLVINAGIAFYHSGVERKIFKDLVSCASNTETPDNLEDLALMLEHTKAVPCDKPQFVFLYLSMAEWNFIYCLGLAILTIIAYRISKPQNT